MKSSDIAEIRFSPKINCDCDWCNTQKRFSWFYNIIKHIHIHIIFEFEFKWESTAWKDALFYWQLKYHHLVGLLYYSKILLKSTHDLCNLFWFFFHLVYKPNYYLIICLNIENDGWFWRCNQSKNFGIDF